MAEEKTVRNETSQGEVRIASDVIAEIAGMAAMEVEGVSSMDGNITRDLIGKLSGKKLSRGVIVEMNGTGVKIRLSLILAYGYRIREVSKKVQEKVASSVESMTGKKVLDVSICVAGIRMQNEA